MNQPNPQEVTEIEHAIGETPQVKA